MAALSNRGVPDALARNEPGELGTIARAGRGANPYVRPRVRAGSSAPRSASTFRSVTAASNSFRPKSRSDCAAGRKSSNRCPMSKRSNCADEERRCAISLPISEPGLRRFHQRWQNLPPERRRRIARRLRRMQTLPPLERERAMDAMPFWRSLDPAERQAVLDFIERLPHSD